jgi:hypothetical protein
LPPALEVRAGSERKARGKGRKTVEEARKGRKGETKEGREEVKGREGR